MSRPLACCLALAVLPLAAVAQHAPDDQARRLEDGRAYGLHGKLEQALDNFEIVVTSFPATGSVALAARRAGP